MFRRVLQQAVGGYRTAFEPAEDHDFVLRIAERSQVYNLCERLVTYRLNHSGLTVVGHQYVEQLRGILIELARRRRSGQPENLDAAMPQVLVLKQKRKPSRGLSGVMQGWRDSFYAANRYYGFGCRELCAGQLQRARRCFVQSLHTNGMFVKSWIGFVLSLMPFVASRARFLFRSSMQQQNDHGWSPLIDADSGPLTSVAHGTAAR
jgi:hypothetical protein